MFILYVIYNTCGPQVQFWLLFTTLLYPKVHSDCYLHTFGPKALLCMVMLCSFLLLFTVFCAYWVSCLLLFIIWKCKNPLVKRRKSKSVRFGTPLYEFPRDYSGSWLGFTFCCYLQHFVYISPLFPSCFPLFPCVSLLFPYCFHLFPYVFLCFPLFSLCFPLFPYVSICFPLFSLCFPLFPSVSFCFHMFSFFFPYASISFLIFPSCFLIFPFGFLF